MNPVRLRAYILLLIASAIWGIAGPVIKYTLGGIDALTFLVYRFGISTLIALIFFPKITFHWPKDPKVLLWLFVTGLFSSTIGIGLLFFGLETTTVLDMTLITLMAPLLAAGSGVRFLHERITLREKVGMGIALIGTFFTVIEPLTSGIGDGLQTSGNALILLYLISTIVPAVLTKKLLRAKVKPLTITNMEFIIGFVTLLPFYLAGALRGGGLPVVSNQLTNLPINYHFGVFYMALLSGTLAYYLYNRAQKSIEVGEVAVFAYLYPLFAAPLAVLWLGEKVTYHYVIGAIIIAVGVIIAEVKRTRLSKLKTNNEELKAIT